jgi:hypothetical protein
MIKVFISHKQEDAYTANCIANELKALQVSYYLDLIDYRVTNSGKELTDHIKHNLNNCTDIIVVMSQNTKYSQWVPFEVGMSAQIDMPTATYLQGTVDLPEFLEYWPRLKHPNDIQKYVVARNDVQQEYRSKYLYESVGEQKSQTARFYEVLKQRL